MAVMTTEDAGTVLATGPLCRQKEALGLGLTPGLPLAWPDSQAQGHKDRSTVSIQYQVWLPLDISSKENSARDPKVMLLLYFCSLQ